MNTNTNPEWEYSSCPAKITRKGETFALITPHEGKTLAEEDIQEIVKHLNAPSPRQIEEMELLAMDTKKRFSYSKHEGTWAWYNADEDDQVDAWHTGFTTRLEALADAVEPYLTPDEEE